MSDWLSLTISTVSLVFSCVSTVVAGLVAFLTLVRRPRVAMTRPTFIALAFEGDESLPKVFTRTLLFCTAEPGKVIEAMYARVSQRDHHSTFAFWSYPAEGRLVAGGGLFVGTRGIATDHHFVLGNGAKRPVFLQGKLMVSIWARVAGEQNARCLHECPLVLTAEQADALNNSCSVFFERSPESDGFQGEIDNEPASISP